jgi:hypothetical protein
MSFPTLVKSKWVIIDPVLARREIIHVLAVKAEG